MAILTILDIWYILWTFGPNDLVIKRQIWYISPRFGILCHDKSGNPDRVVAAVRRLGKNSENLFCAISFRTLLQVVAIVAASPTEVSRGLLFYRQSATKAISE
jgi:hypothetical protein